jgi:hypothetical protein
MNQTYKHYTKVDLIQDHVNRLNANSIREFHNEPHPIQEPETWQLVRWLINELADQGICTNDFSERLDKARELEK